MFRRVAAQVPTLVLPESMQKQAIALAVSGGADSVYLLCALWANPEYRPFLRVWHFNHRVRGQLAQQDADFVRTICQSLQIPCVIGERAEVGPASEQELRQARNHFFAEQRKNSGINFLCTAHHYDDLVETLLMRLARGSGLTGLAAPRIWQKFRDGHSRYRPLLAAGLNKEFILHTLKTCGVSWREDATNAQPITQRNRVRAWLSEGAEYALGPHYQRGFARSAEIIDQAEQALLLWVKDLGCELKSNGVAEVGALKNRPPILAHLVFGQFLQHHGLGAASGSSVDTMIHAIISGLDTQVSILGRLVKLKNGLLSLVAAALIPLGSKMRELTLGKVDDEVGLLAEPVDVDEAQWEKLSRGDIPPLHEVYLRPVAVGKIYWRGRMEGDRYQPLGLSSPAKVSDMLINRKVPLELRENIPVVILNGEIVWIPSIPPNELFRLNGPTKGALRLTWRAPCLGSTVT